MQALCLPKVTQRIGINISNNRASFRACPIRWPTYLSTALLDSETASLLWEPQAVLLDTVFLNQEGLSTRFQNLETKQNEMEEVIKFSSKTIKEINDRNKTLSGGVFNLLYFPMYRPLFFPWKRVGRSGCGLSTTTTKIWEHHNMNIAYEWHVLVCMGPQ